MQQIQVAVSLRAFEGAEERAKESEQRVEQTRDKRECDFSRFIKNTNTLYSKAMPVGHQKE